MSAENRNAYAKNRFTESDSASNRALIARRYAKTWLSARFFRFRIIRCRNVMVPLYRYFDFVYT